MGNKPAKLDPSNQDTAKEARLKVLPPLDPHLLKWLDRDIQMMQNFTPKKNSLLTPPDHYIQYMQLYGHLDLDMNDPELSPLFK